MKTSEKTGYSRRFNSNKMVAKYGNFDWENQVKQMEKIEELTLYLLQLKKENDSLKEKIILLETK